MVTHQTPKRTWIDHISLSLGNASFEKNTAVTQPCGTPSSRSEHAAEWWPMRYAKHTGKQKWDVWNAEFCNYSTKRYECRTVCSEDRQVNSETAQLLSHAGSSMWSGILFSSGSYEEIA